MEYKQLIIEREAMASNIRSLKKEMKVPLIGVLKGNGYGLGLLLMAQLLREEGVSFFAVALGAEALALREGGFLEEDILLLTPITEEEEICSLLAAGITLSAASYEGAKKYSVCAKKMEQTAKVHIKVDTGFGRFGFLPENKEDIIKAVRLEHLEAEGIYSHFSCAFEKKYCITKKQLEQFLEVIQYLESFSVELALKHIANSSAALRFPQTRLSAVRLGSALIGRVLVQHQLDLKKVGYLESKVLSTATLPAGHNVGYANTFRTPQRTDIAVIPVGHQDGLFLERTRDTFRLKDVIHYLYQDLRSFQKKMKITIDGNSYRLIGRVGLYNIVADVTHSSVSAGDLVRVEINPLLVDSAIPRVIR